MVLANEVNQVKKIAMGSNGIRKIIRFARAPILYSSLKNRNLNLRFDNQISKLTSVFLLSIFVSDFADLIFYLTDHYSFMELMGVANSKLISVYFNDLGNYLWVLGAAAQIISIFAKGLQMKIEGE